MSLIIYTASQVFPFLFDLSIPSLMAVSTLSFTEEFLVIATVDASLPALGYSDQTPSLMQRCPRALHPASPLQVTCVVFTPPPFFSRFIRISFQHSRTSRFHLSAFRSNTVCLFAINTPCYPLICTCKTCAPPTSSSWFLSKLVSKLGFRFVRKEVGASASEEYHQFHAYRQSICTSNSDSDTR